MSRRAGVPVHNKVVFKDYNHKQSMLPLDIDTSVPDKHMVRIINKAVDDMDMTPLSLCIRAEAVPVSIQP